MWCGIRWVGDAVELLDQRRLPFEEKWVRCEDAASVALSIQAMVVRGAPAIGIAAAYGMALQARRGGGVHRSAVGLDRCAARLIAARPTAVNLRWAVERMRAAPESEWEAMAVRIHEEDAANCRALGDHGAALLGEHPTVYHHCNTGALATGGWGTAMGIVRSVHAQGRRIHVFVGETRPWLQGGRLTAWELLQEEIPATLLVDAAAATVLDRCDAVLVGCDRVAANGDVANKTGTLGLAILARHFEVPVIVAMPRSTLDLTCASGADIPVERRGADEVRGYGGQIWAPDIAVENPAFDVTPADLVSAWVTESGLWWPPGRAAGWSVART